MKRSIISLFLLLLQVSLCVALAVTKKDVQMLVETRRFDEAVTALKVLMQQPAFEKDAECNKWLGQSLCVTGHYAESLPYLEFAIRQNRKSGAQWYMAITLQHLYDFEGALEALEEYRPVLHSDFWLSRADSLEAEIQQGIRAMEHVQDVVVIDSLIVPRATFFSSYRLGAESGRILQGTDGLFFENQTADYRIYAVNDELFQSHKIQGNWEDGDLLAGVGSSKFRVVAPFMRSDGETLYFASDSVPGLGGLDIFKTKFNAEEGEFYQPERLGMPFNSPFDDYMMAIDETHQVGWWATERRGDVENVVIYLFLLDDDPEYLDEASVSRARIDNIAETWRQKEGYAELVASLMNADQHLEVHKKLSIIINDATVYTGEDQFVSPSARKAYAESQKIKEQLEDAEAHLGTLRDEYAKASAPRKRQLRALILQLEQQQFELTDQWKQLVKLYRKSEQ